jgi:hypothetical protein
MNNELDPQAYNLAKAIKRAETGGSKDPYRQKGASGEFGAYQFMPSTYKALAKQHLGDENAEPTVENQNKITYSEVKRLKDSGYSPAQIASYWNSGKTDTYKSGGVGTNKMGVKYDVPAYVNKVSQYYNELKGQTAEASTITPEVSQEQPKKSFMEKAGGVLDSIFGGGKIGEAIGTQIAKARATPEERQYIQDAPSAGQIAGDVGRVALNFAPVGRIAKGLATGVKAVPLLSKVAQPIANIGTGAIVGGTGQALGNIAEGQSPEVGTGALLGAGISSIPYVGKGIARLGSEALGATTGTGAGVINKYTSSIAKGGEIADIANQARKGNLNPQDIVDEAKTAFGTLFKERSDEYTTQLSKLKTKTNVIDHTPIIQKFNKQLDDFGVFFNGDGTPNFSRAPGLGRYEGDLQKLSKTLSEWGTREGDNTIAGIDKLKQVIDDFKIGSQDAKKFDTFVSSLRSEAKDLIKKDLMKSKDLKTLSTYEKMLGDFEKSTKEIREIQKALSLGDKASVDTAFRKLSTVLRTNNEIRQQAVARLDEITGGTLLPKIAGQQLSEILPRGLSRIVTTGGTGIGLATGAGILAMLKVAIFTSPRLVGKLLNILGIFGQKAELVKQALLKGGISPGDALLDKIGKKSNVSKTITPEVVSKKPTVKTEVPQQVTNETGISGEVGVDIANRKGILNDFKNLQEKRKGVVLPKRVRDLNK